jgi:diadenylate cyclase
MRFTDYISINGLRNIVDILLVFVLVYVVLKLLRGTRAVPTVIGLVLLGALYWLALAEDLATLEFVLRYAVVYNGLALKLVFEGEIMPARF